MFDVKHPPGIDLRWLPRDGISAGRSTLLADELRSLPLPHLRIGLIAHAERSAVKEISQVARHWHLDKHSTHISSYWTLREERLRR